VPVRRTGAYRHKKSTVNIIQHFHPFTKHASIGSKYKVRDVHVLVRLTSVAESSSANSGRVTTTEQTGVCPRTSLGSRMNVNRAVGSRVGSRIRTRNARRFSVKARNTTFSCSSVLAIGTRFPAISRYCGFSSITCTNNMQLFQQVNHR